MENTTMTDRLTHFTESNALLAVVRDDEEEVERILRMMSEPELRALRNSAALLADYCRTHMRRGDHAD
jgi:hypothetical protein